MTAWIGLASLLALGQVPTSKALVPAAETGPRGLRVSFGFGTYTPSVDAELGDATPYGDVFGGSGWMVPSEALQFGRVDGQHDSVGRLMTHPNYPPGIPALHCLVGSHLERFSEDATRPLMSLYVLGCAALLWSWLSKRSLGAAVAGTLSWVSLPFLYYSKVWYPFIKMPPQVP